MIMTNKSAIAQTKHVGHIKVLQSADMHPDSIIEFSIIPDEKTPWHYHTLFSETFEILKGTLEIGKNKEVFQLSEGDVVSINPYDKHYFHNISKEVCLIKVIASPANKDFEHALLISKGLARDGLASASGSPKRITDLALFVYLNNSQMVGVQKIAQPLFNYLARRAIKKGSLKKLTLKYC